MKIDNQSKLINDLLSDFFEISSKNHSILDQKTAVLNQNKAKLKKVKKEIKVLRYCKEHNFDQKCINWIYGKEFIYSETDIIMYIRNRSIKIKPDEFKKCIEMLESYGYLWKKTAI